MDSNEDRAMGLAAERLALIFAKSGVCESHGLNHALEVASLAARALQSTLCDIAPSTCLAVRLAALLHDADDRKFFPTNDSHQNAREVLAHLAYADQPLSESFVDLVLRMIGWVSAATNRDTIPTEALTAPYLLYPRHADRLTAIGWTGVFRCLKFTIGIGRPLFRTNTARARDEKDLRERVAPPRRYRDYCGDSETMIDHYYDKLLHISQALLEQENTFIRDEAHRRSEPLVEIALLFGRTGTLPEDLYERSQALAEKERLWGLGLEAPPS